MVCLPKVRGRSFGRHSSDKADRAAHQREQAVAAKLLPDVGDTAIVVTDWHFVGREYPPSLPLTGGAA